MSKRKVYVQRFCKVCGKGDTEAVPNSRKNYCIDCAVSVMVKAMHEMADLEGEQMTKWAAGMIRAASGDTRARRVAKRKAERAQAQNMQ